MGVPIFQVDAFTDKPFSGNPAAVCILPEVKEERWMQDVAREMNLSETAFLCPAEDGYHLRWFTPRTEVDLCGHATLATAHVLWEAGYLKGEEEARFHTRSGLLTAQLKGNWIELNFPAKPQERAVVPPEVIAALGVTPLYTGKNASDYLIEVESEEIVRNIQPNFVLLAKAPVRGVIVTSRASSPAYDFVSRFFAPRVGINEDPVTGSAHCCLGPYWQEKLKREEFLACQASERGGFIKVRVENQRVYLAGQAITILRGEMVG
jgi:PhzF family phenazine biosynthesis protein